MPDIVLDREGSKQKGKRSLVGEGEAINSEKVKFMLDIVLIVV